MHTCLSPTKALGGGSGGDWKGTNEFFIVTWSVMSREFITPHTLHTQLIHDGWVQVNAATGGHLW